MSVFADSSAIVKLYSDEEGSRSIRNLGVMAVSEIARVEVPAALWRKHRMSQLSLESVTVLVRTFEGDYAGHAVSGTILLPIAVTSAVIERAAGLLASSGLRAYDALQLASALAARDADPECSTFAAFDSELRTAAAYQGFTSLP
ncbi:MAG TPA: type II toxin-antitoxin system VapC family toxin [Homoserinimonas sp.]|nr:type II toxin-antitoxin system VapC family toxin [Homoserinimonas sp.]